MTKFREDDDGNQWMKKRGRPPIGTEIMATKLEIRLTGNERSELDRAASLSELPTSRWARNALLELARKTLEQATKPTPESK